MVAAILAVVLVALAGQGAPVVSPPDGLSAARLLYASGAYEDALTRLSTVTDEESAAGVAQYRALCLLALGRPAEARRSLEDLVSRRPLYRMADADVSPQLVSLFQDVRRRMLPDITRTLYLRARADFDKKQYREAAAGFRDVLELLAGEDTSGESATLGDFKVLADEFLKLSVAQVPADAAVTPAPPLPALLPLPVTPVGAPPPAPIYALGDAGVLPPVDVSRPMPPWRAPTPAEQARERRGLLKIIIDERGYVEYAAIMKPIVQPYDTELLEATRHWKFRPAVKDGVAVKYEKLIEIVIGGKIGGG
jgi:hypothetical protein